MNKRALHTKAMDDASEEFESMYKAHKPLIYRFMFWRTKDEMLAQDLTSNVFEKAWKTRASFTGGSSKAWLYRIAHTTLIDYWRKKRDVPDDGGIIEQAESNEPAMGEVLDRAMAVEALQDAMLKLPAEMYRVVTLRFIEGFSVRDTADRLHMSEGNVRVVQYRALQKLRKYLS